MTNVETPQKSLAAKIMEELFHSNTYQTSKEKEFELKEIASEFKRRQPDELKFWDLGKIVAMRQFTNSFETNHQGLNELLFDLGILVQSTYFEERELPTQIKKKIEPFKLPVVQFVKFNPKRGLVNKVKVSYEKYDNEALVDLWLRVKKEQDEAELDIEKAKELMMTCEELKENGRVETEFGSASLMNKKSTYDMNKVFSNLGHEFIINHSKVSMTQLNEFVVSGVITEKEINEYKQIIDFSSRYVVLSKDSLQNQSNMMNFRKHKQAGNLAELWSHKKQA